MRQGPMRLAATTLFLLLMPSATMAIAGTSPHQPDLNEASRAEIESLRGVGVELADRILTARRAAPFADVHDLKRRVKGVSRQALRGLLEAGMTVGGLAVPPDAATGSSQRTTPPPPGAPAHPPGPGR